MNETNTLDNLLKTTEECIALLDSEVHDKVRDSLKLYKSTGILVYENKDLSSNLIGQRFAIGYGGPENTLQGEVEGSFIRCPVSPPQGYGWQYYLIAYSEDQ